MFIMYIGCFVDRYLQISFLTLSNPFIWMNRIGIYVICCNIFVKTLYHVQTTYLYNLHTASGTKAEQIEDDK